MRVKVPSVKEAAELTGLAPRTLQRRLQGEGLDYRSLVNRVRYDEAVTLLGGEDQSVTEISKHLGYANSANFNHAFNGWTGTSPSNFRERTREGSL